MMLYDLTGKVQLLVSPHLFHCPNFGQRLIVMAPRSCERGEQAPGTIRAAVNNRRVILMPIDISSGDPIRKFTDALQQGYDNMDCFRGTERSNGCNEHVWNLPTTR